MQDVTKKLSKLQCNESITNIDIKNICNIDNIDRTYDVKNKVFDFRKSNIENIDSTHEEKDRLCNKTINFCNFNLNKSIHDRSYINEVTIPVTINGIKLYALLDSGSESSILTLKYAEKFFKNWRNFPNGFYKLDYGIGVDGSRFKILGTKLFTVQIGSTILNSSFSIPERGSELIIGLDLLKLFNITMHFSSKIHLYCNDEYITSEFLKNQAENLNTINMKCVLRPNEAKTYTITNESFIDNCTYLSYSHENCASIVIPSASIAKNGSLKIVLKNDSKKKQVFKPKTLKIISEKIDPKDIYDLKNIEGKNAILESETLPIHFYNKNSEFNNKYYKGTKENISKINFLNNIFETNENGLNDKNEDTLENLSQLPGLSLPEINFPIKSANEIVQEYLKGKYTVEQRTFLTNEFEKYPTLISQFTYDCGKMTDIYGNLITMDIPLKKPLPVLTKTYKLSQEEKAALHDILDYICYFNLAENASVDNIRGSPCFLVGRPDQNRAHRIIFDVREVNKYIKAPVSTYSDCVTAPLKIILSKYNYLSCVDLRNAFYSLRLSKKSLDSNISQVITDERCVRFYTPLTGTSFIPVFWSDTVNKQLSLNDDGLFDPLTTPNSYFKSWYDDLLIATIGDEETHKEHVKKFLYRINRLGLKINLEKSEFFINIQSDNFKLLGFEIDQGKIIPNKKKLNVLKDFKSPKSTQDVQKYLGYLNFIRHLLPLKVLDLTTVLTPLTSSVNQFKWTMEHEKAFNMINEILHSNISFAEPQSDNGIKIIYSDASDKLLGGILFCYNIDYFEHNPPNDLVDIESTYKDHVDFYKINCKQFVCGKPNLSHFKNFIHLVSASLSFHHDVYDWEENNISQYLNSIFGCILKIRTFFTTDKHLNEFLGTICFNEVSDDFFMENFMEILAITSVIFKSNIKLIFGNNRVQKKPYFCLSTDFDNDILLGFDKDNNKFTLFYVMEPFENNNSTITSNNKILPQHTNPKKVFEHFKATLDSNKAKEHIKIVSQFSKSIPKSEQSQAIYLKESAALLYSLEAFKNEIRNAPLTLICTDSRVSFFMFNPNVQNSSKKLIRWSLKIALSFNNVHVLNISGRDNIADFLSRLGLSKQTFFARTLSPLQLNHEERKKLPELLTWTDISKYCSEYPNLIKFSECKIDTKIQNDYFIDVLQHNDQTSKHNTLKLFMEQSSFLDKFLSRDNLIKNQLKERKLEGSKEHNGVLFYNDQPILPESLYVMCIMREHILGLHLGTLSLIKTCTNIFYIKNKQLFKTLVERLCKACLSCILVKTEKNRQKHGLFKIDKSNICVQMDFIENLPTKNKFLLVLVDIYSRFCTTYVLNNKTTTTVINCLRNYLGNFGVIKYLISDNYAGFRSKEFKKFVKTHGISHPTSAAYKSRARAYVELYNGILQRGLKNLTIFERESWCDLIPMVTFLLNNRIFYNETLTPSQLHFGVSYLRHDFLRPEQKELFKSIIPKNFINANTHFKEIIDDEEQKFNERRIKNLKQRQARTNKNKIDSKLMVDDFVVIKDYGETIGVSRKLKPTYDYIPYKITNIKYYNCLLVNMLDGTQIMRAIDNIKKIELINKGEKIFSDIPDEIFNLLNVLTYDNILEIFSKKNDETPKQIEPRTRLEVEKEREKELLLDEILDLDEDELLEHTEKVVRFE